MTESLGTLKNRNIKDFQRDGYKRSKRENEVREWENG